MVKIYIQIPRLTTVSSTADVILHQWSPSYIYIASLEQYEIHASLFTILLDPKVLKELPWKYEMLITLIYI